MQNADAESALVGCVILHSPWIPQAIHALGDAEAIRDRHLRRVWDLAIDLYRQGREIDLVVMVQALRGDTHAPHEGWEGMLIECVSTVGSHHRYAEYAAAVRDNYQRTMVIDRARRMAVDLKKDWSRTATTIVGEHLPALRESAGDPAEWDVSLQQALHQDRESWIAGDKGYLTGIGGIDDVTRGMEGGDLVVLSALPSVGKTAFALTVLADMAQTMPVAMASLEMSAAKIGRRAMSLVTGNSYQDARVAAPHTRQDMIDRTMAKKWTENLIVNDKLRGIDEIIAWTEHVAHKGCKVIAIDYLQRIDPSDPRAAPDRQIAMMTKALKDVAFRTDTVVMLLAQVNRVIAQQARDRPVASDLRGSSAIEADADQIWFLWRETRGDRPDPRETVRWYAAKNRNGEAGDGTMQILSFNPSTTRIYQ